jgi:tRNA(Ile)-lysidine synthase
LTVKRPLIDVSREEILGYVEENGLTFRTDSTNADTAYTRNFIRAEIVPLLKKVNPAAEKNARESAKTVAEALAILDEF